MIFTLRLCILPAWIKLNHKSFSGDTTVNYKFADNMKQIKSSATVSLAEKAKSLKDAGVSVIDLTIGEPDFLTPDHINEAGYRAMKNGQTKYTNSRGIIELRKAVSAKMEKDYGVSYSPDQEIIVTPGGKQGIVYCILAMINPGDEVLTLEPCWVGYESAVQLAAGKYVGIQTKEDEGYAVTEKMIEDKITPRTKMLIINSPSNPTGKVLSREELEIIAGICIRKGLILISDDIYEKIIFDQNRFVSVAGFKDMRERTIILNGFSKAYSMTGWRLAYLAADKKIIGEINKLQQLSATCPSSVSQWAGVEALNGPQDSIAMMTGAYQKRRDMVCDHLNKKITCFRPQGAFYAFLNMNAFGWNSDQACDQILEKCKIVTVPGSAFGKAGEGYVRISFGTSDENIRQAMKNLDILI